jgi:uncharacterized protein
MFEGNYAIITNDCHRSIAFSKQRVHALIGYLGNGERERSERVIASVVFVCSIACFCYFRTRGSIFEQSFVSESAKEKRKRKTTTTTATTAMKSALIEKLGLIAHPEGGFFREIYRSGSVAMRSKGKTDFDGRLMKTSSSSSVADEDVRRNVMTSIYYLIEDYQGLVCNQSDHVHYHHYGCTVLYHVVNPNDGEYEVRRLGTNVSKGDQPQVVVPGKWFKAATLEKTREHDFALLGEGVAPGFDFNDFEFVSKEKLKRTLANSSSNYFVLERLCKPEIEDTDLFYAKSDEEKTEKFQAPIPDITPQKPPAPPPPQSNTTNNTPPSKPSLQRTMAEKKIVYEDIGQSTPQFKAPGLNMIDRDNIPLTPMGMPRRIDDDDDGEQSLELETP